MRNNIQMWMVLMMGSFGMAVAEQAKLPTFTDVTDAAGITFSHSVGDFEMSNIVEGTGAGAVVFDYDGDGWQDIYLLSGRWNKQVNDNRGRTLRGKLSNRLYRNNGNGSFTDVTDKAGVGGGESFACGGSAADFDGDGDLDLYVCNFGPNLFYRNNGDGTFTDISQSSGLADPQWSLSAPWFDYNNDGRLDVFVCNYLEYDSGKFRSYYAAAGYPGPLSYNGQPDSLYRNNGDGTFTDTTRDAGLENREGRGMSATVADFDNDGFLDIYVANDASDNDFFRNLGNNSFVNEAMTRGLAFGEGGQGVSSMGPAVGDVDRDGRLDLFIPDMGYNCLLMNRGEFFEDLTAKTGIAVVCGQYTGWGGQLLDYDNDGWLDIFVANGDPHHEYREEAVLLRNDGTGKFVDVAKQSGPFFAQKFVGRGSTCLDFDNDGDLDLLIVNLNDRARLIRNDGTQNHWILIEAKLSNGKSDAIGARITVITGSLKQIRDLIPVTGYLSQADPRCHFGIGIFDKADRIEIRWPDKTQTVLENVKADQILKVVQPKR